MQTKILDAELRPNWLLAKPRRKRADPIPRGVPGLLAQYWLLTDSRRVALELDDASRLPASVRDGVLDLIPDALEWLLAVAELRPAAYDLQLGKDDKVYIRLRDACAECQAPPAAVLWPPVSPQFCGKECALSWLEDRAEDVPHMADLDEYVREAVEKAEAEGAAKAEEEALEQYNSDDNPIMEVVRRYGEPDPTLTAEAVAWRLERSFRAGLRL